MLSELEKIVNLAEIHFFVNAHIISEGLLTIY